ncbi:MAG TPA: TonB-dependent receptor [Pyrinomonadaceae bacterium]|nr:TonB-dependent receptor [Pyrinomonadaceae bacterium]
MRTIVIGFLLIFVVVVPARGQVASASLLGEVRDQLAAQIPGVKVTARHEAMGFSRSVLTGNEGSYRLDDLLPGRYVVSAEKQGFRTLTVEAIVLEVNQKGKLDLELQVGEPQETVTITADVSLVQTHDATVGYRLDTRTIGALPLDGRNIISLVTLGPGAIPRQLGGFGHDIINDVQENRGSVAMNPTINGARSTMNTFLLDGGMNTDLNTRAIAVNPPIESVQEFRILSSLPSAEFAQSGGGVADVVTKSGGQVFHGNLFEFFRHDSLDALSLFADPNLPRPVFRQSQFGGSLGGRLPASSTFFFATYEGLRGKAARTSQSLVPDAALRSGDFRGRNTIYDPFNVDPVTGARQPFANNIIPAGRIDPIARKFLDTYQPLPNRPLSGAVNYLDSTPNKNTRDSLSARLDHEFRDHGRVFGRFTLNDDRNRLATAFPERPTQERVRAQQAVIGHSTSGQSWLNEARLSFTRLKVLELPESAFQSDATRDLGITSFPSDPFNFGLPFFLVSNFNLVLDTPNRPQTQRDNLWNLSEGITFNKGAHTLKTGLQLIYFQLNYLQSQLSRGRYTFTGAFTSNPQSPSPSGDPFADFLLGFPQSTDRSVGQAQAYLRQTNYAGYLHDDWQVNGRLNLSFGVRYEYFSPYHETRNNLLNLDYSTIPAPPQLVRSSEATEPDRNNFAPRVGLAWRPPLSFLERRNTVLRAGYGIYYTPEIATEVYDLVRNGIINETNQTAGDGTPLLTLSNGFPQTASTGLRSYFGLDPRARTPYMQHWSLGLQQELPTKILLDVAYVGSKGTKLGKSRIFNTPAHIETGENLPPRPGDLQSLRTWPQLGRLIQRQHISNSSFHSMQIKAERRFSGDLAFLASFVWAKSIDNGDTVLNGLFDSVTAQDERNLQLERGLSFFDVRRRLSVGFIYNLPKPNFLRPLLAHWQASGILTMQDGTPLNPVYFFSDFANSGTPNRPDVVAGQSISLPRNQRSADHWFNTAAFQSPAPFSFGNAGRNIIPGPGNLLFDFALHRRFEIREGQAIEFRAESFNLFNHPNYGIPLPFADFGPFFGKVVAVGEPRRIQFALRFDF